MKNRHWASFGVAMIMLITSLGPSPMAVAQTMGTPTFPMDGGTVRGPGGTVIQIVDGDTVFVDTGGEQPVEVRLVGVQAPKLPLGRKHFQSWPMAQRAASALGDFLLGKQVRLHYGTSRKDRHGRQLAHLALMQDQRPDIWVQGWLIQQGWARVYSFADNRLLVSRLLDFEIDARTRRDGIWSHSYYQVRQATDLARKSPRFTGRFELVEGRILDIAHQKRRSYLNFGPDWRTDFTVSIEARDLKLFKDGKTNLDDLKGKLIRVRGWISDRNGPMIRLTHPEQLEVLE